MLGDYELMTSLTPIYRLWCISDIYIYIYIPMIYILLTLGKLKFTLFGSLYSLWTGHSYFTYWVWLRHAAKSDSSNSSFDKNSGTTRIRSGISHFQWSNQQESRTGFFSQ